MTACDLADTRSFDQGANDLQAVADPRWPSRIGVFNNVTTERSSVDHCVEQDTRSLIGSRSGGRLLSFLMSPALFDALSRNLQFLPINKT